MHSTSRRHVIYPVFVALCVTLLMLCLAGHTFAHEPYDPAEEIEHIRAEIARRGYSWTAGETSMNRLPPEERSMWLGLKLPADFVPVPQSELLRERPSSLDLPAVWDWRAEGGVTPVKHQGQCGSCWIFCAVGAFESVILIETGVEHDLSEQQVLVCNEGGYGCDGGWMYAAYDLFMSPGAVSEECMPYEANDGLPCTQDTCEIVDRIDCYVDVAPDITSIKERVYLHPLSTTMTVYDDFFSYTGGCYEHPGNDWINHCVLIVGWDDTACGGSGAWICKNSWGTGWGIDGFFYIKYGSCNIGSDAQEIIYRGEHAEDWTDATTETLGDAGWGHGLAWVDYDNDDDLDIFVANREGPNRLFRNDGLAADLFVEATPVVLADTADCRAAAWGDYDNDGDLDIYVSIAGPNRLFRNDGNGNFLDVTVSPLDDSGIGQTASWADYDTDGDVDIYLVNNGPNKLFRNDGGGTFADVTSGPLGNSGFGLGAGWADYDNDGDMDIYVANYDGANVLLQNQGGGVFGDATTPVVGITAPSAGVAWGDYDNDGDLDLYATNDGPNCLLRNDGGVFSDVTAFPLDDRHHGRSAAWGDYDLDGDLDLYLVNHGGRNTLFTNEGDGSFTSPTCGLLPGAGSLVGISTAWADYDEDGDPDLYLVNNGRNGLFRNDDSSGYHWLNVKLVGTASNTYGQGARVRIVAGGGRQMREIAGASGYISQGPLVAMFGLGAVCTLDTLEVAWPSGYVQTFTGVGCDQSLEIVETDPAGVISEAEIISDFNLHPCLPNPFRTETVIRYDLPVAARVDLAIYDATGRLVRRLLEGRLDSPGRHAVCWNGRNGHGRAAAPGVYFCELLAGPHAQTRRVLLVK